MYCTSSKPQIQLFYILKFILSIYRYIITFLVRQPDLTCLKKSLIPIIRTWNCSSLIPTSFHFNFHVWIVLDLHEGCSDGAENSRILCTGVSVTDTFYSCGTFVCKGVNINVLATRPTPYSHSLSLYLTFCFSCSSTDPIQYLIRTWHLTVMSF